MRLSRLLQKRLKKVSRQSEFFVTTVEIQNSLKWARSVTHGLILESQNFQVSKRGKEQSRYPVRNNLLQEKGLNSFIILP